MNKIDKLPPTPTSSNSSDKLGGTGTDHGDESSEENLSVPNSLIGAENYLTLTEGKLSALTKEELAEAVTKCKLLILDSAVCSDERKWLVRRLIELRYQLLAVQEVEVKDDEEPDDSRIVLGHHFNMRYQPTSTTKRFCDVCCGTIWNVLQSWYQCSDCRYRCHIKCIGQIIRPCPHLTSYEKTCYEVRICPERGLADQNYQCTECKLQISFKNSWLAPRLCDYTGLYYCTSCHWNNTAVIPARAFRNWDFKPYLVSRSAYQMLRYTRNRTLITIDSKLYGYVQELAELKRYREEFSKMKSYLVRCRNAKPEKKLLWKVFGTRSHLLEPSELLSLRDLIELHNHKLLDQLKDLSNQFTDHITESCKICSGQGYICEFCRENDVIFPFSRNIYICQKCSWVYHKSCWLRNLNCSKCERIQKKKQDAAAEHLEVCKDVHFD